MADHIDEALAGLENATDDLRKANEELERLHRRFEAERDAGGYTPLLEKLWRSKTAAAEQRQQMAIMRIEQFRMVLNRNQTIDGMEPGQSDTG